MFKKKVAPPTERRRPIVREAPPRQAVFSYHAARSARPMDLGEGRDTEKADESAISARRKRRSSLLRNTRVVGVSLALVLFLVLDMALSTSPKVIVTGDASGQVFLRSTSIYTDAAHQLLAKSILNHNKITIDTASISNNLLREFPELTAVSVSLPIFGSKPIVYIQPSDPKLILSTQSSGSFLLDASGRALANTSGIKNLSSLHLQTVTDQSGLAVQVGQTALTAADVTFVTQVVGQLQAKSVGISSMTLPAATSELDVHPTGVGYFVKFNLAATDARQEAGTFLAVRQYLTGQKQTPASYIDVRVPGRAYYK